MNKINRHKIIKVLLNHFFEVVIKIEVKDNNIETFESFKKKATKRWF